MWSKGLFLAAMIWIPLLSAAQTQSANTTNSCNVPPFALQIKEQSFSTGLTSWGILFQIGGPQPQRVSLVPSTVTNSTLVNQRIEGGLCNLSNTTLRFQCESIRGGFYNQNNSATWRPQPDLKNSNISREEPTWDHFNEEKTDPLTGLRIEGIKNIGYDDIHLRGSEDFILHSAGIALNQRGNQSNAGMLGLGLDSVFLDDVVAQNRSPSRSWGLDAGSRSSTRGRDGELVIGGWNEGRLDGDWWEFNVSNMNGGVRSCPLSVKMTDITLLSPGEGNEASLKDFSTTITACIEPYDNHFRWQAGMIDKWKTLTGFDQQLVDPYTTSDQGLAFIEPGLPYEKSKAQGWQLRITLEGGYQTTITYDEMTRDLEGWNKNGVLERVPDISNVAILNIPIREDETPTLGKIFLSRTYLRVDYELGKFYLAPSDTGTPADSKLVAMRPPSCDAPQTTLEPKNDAGGTPVGPIVGGVVGGVAVAILFVAFLIWFGKRRRSRGKKKHEMAFRGPSRRGTNDPEPATNGTRWPGFIGPPVERDREHSYATTSNGQRLLSGAGVSPRTSGQDVGTREERVHSNTSDIPPMSPTDYTTPAELDATKREDV